MDTEIDVADFDWLTLDTDEEVRWADTPHPYSLVPVLVIGIPLSLFVVGIPLLVAGYLSFKNTNYVVTSDALYKKTGVLSRNVQRIEFDKVQDTSYSQTFLGAQFGYGSVNISTAGGSGIEMSFDSVADPQTLQSLVNERIKQRSGRATESDGKAAVLDDILAELRAIRAAVEGGTESRVSTSGDDTAETVGAQSDGTTRQTDEADFDFDTSVTDDR
ncbi:MULTISPECIES: PH domain-containing protein [Haloferax]|uniref:PH domain-containing protein n=1 Tax=Haloferax marinum TaxID=2666143 RepID=A0A6A8G2V7_9EURY|nr:MULTISPECIES: PH domain-containing protein [Haloferax]KAB1196510.1 PH domain-containing protein [Haloferax sp. CBA1150]MRW95510.1 PH domain-containing protein [Haloferax marinum]